MPPYIYMSASQVDSAAARHKTVRGWKSQFSCVSACQRRLMFWLPSRTILIQSGHTQYSSLYGGTEFYWTIFNNLCQPLKLAKSHRNHLGIMVFYISGECFHLPAALSNTWLSTIAGSRCCFKVLINYAGHNNVFLASVSSCLILIPWWSVAFLFIYSNKISIYSHRCCLGWCWSPLRSSRRTRWWPSSPRATAACSSAGWSGSEVDILRT